MSNKRLYLLRNLFGVGIDLSRIGVKLTFYIAVAAATTFLFGGYLLAHLPNAEAIVYYLLIMLLVIAIQITQIIRRDREELTRQQFELDVEHFIANGRRK
jgi:hypothetical protein